MRNGSKETRKKWINWPIGRWRLVCLGGTRTVEEYTPESRCWRRLSFIYFYSCCFSGFCLVCVFLLIYFIFVFIYFVVQVALLFFYNVALVNLEVSCLNASLLLFGCLFWLWFQIQEPPPSVNVLTVAHRWASAREAAQSWDIQRAEN